MRYPISKSVVLILALCIGLLLSCDSEDSVDNMKKDEVNTDNPNDGGDGDDNNEEQDSTQTETPVILLSDELTGAYTTCNEGKSNDDRNTDIPNSVNIGTVDDRTCYDDYYEVEVGGKKWGAYNITHESNHKDTKLQPRIERSLARASSTRIGTYVHFTGSVRILETGKTSSSGSDGTYIMQTKGKHTGGGGSPDPAICLYLAKPVYGTTEETKDEQVSFDIFREQIKYRGGEGSGREVVFLTNVPKGQVTHIELKVGFREDPSDASKKIHYSDAIIGDDVFNWNIPEPERGTQSGIRYGAYRVKGGRAQIRWADTTYKKVEK